MIVVIAAISLNPDEQRFELMMNNGRVGAHSSKLIKRLAKANPLRYCYRNVKLKISFYMHHFQPVEFIFYKNIFQDKILERLKIDPEKSGILRKLKWTLAFIKLAKLPDSLKRCKGIDCMNFQSIRI